MMVLICLIFSVLSTIGDYDDFAMETLFWMVSYIRIEALNVNSDDMTFKGAIIFTRQDYPVQNWLLNLNYKKCEYLTYFVFTYFVNFICFWLVFGICNSALF